MKGSIVIPVYNEEVFIEKFYYKLYENIDFVKNFEFVFVDDGSRDYSFKILNKLAEKNENIKIVKLEKNYGKQTAIGAGMKVATGDFVIVCSVSPYNPHLAINEAVRKWQNGYSIVRAIKNRKSNKNNFQKFTNFLFGKLTKFFKLNEKILPKATVELYDRDVVDVLNSLPEKNMLLRNLDNWVDFNIYTFKYNVGEVNIVQGKKYAELEKGYNELRKKESIKKDRTLKTRLYFPSLFASAGFLLVFALAVVLLAVLPIVAKLSTFVKIFLWLLIITTLISSFLCGCRAWMIKRIGIVPYIKKDENLYKVKEIIVSK